MGHSAAIAVEDCRPREDKKTRDCPAVARGQYNASLNARGFLLVWLHRDMKWVAPSTGRRKRGPEFTDAAIQFA